MFVKILISTQDIEKSYEFGQQNRLIHIHTNYYRTGE